MRVRILSGNSAGAVVEMDQLEAEINLATGYVEAVAEDAVPESQEIPQQVFPDE